MKRWTGIVIGAVVGLLFVAFAIDSMLTCATQKIDGREVLVCKQAFRVISVVPICGGAP